MVPVSGGGMLSGICVAAKALKPDIKIYGAEPLNADDCAKSFAAKKRIPLPGVCLEPPVAAITCINNFIRKLEFLRGRSVIYSVSLKQSSTYTVKMLVISSPTSKLP